MATLLTIVAAGLTGLGLSGCAESFLFYYPSRRAFQDAPGSQAVTFKTADGLTLSGWFFPARAPEPAEPGTATDIEAGNAPSTETGAPGPDPTASATERAASAASELAELIDQGASRARGVASAPGPRPTILVAHGNAGCLPDHDEFCSFLSSYGFNVLLFDYRGYGRSDLPKRGLCRADLVLDTKAAFEYLLTRPDVDAERIGLLGYSLGGNIGLGFVADEPRIRAVVTLSTFSKWKDVAADHGGALGRLLIPGGMDATDSVARLGARPLLIVHGDDDDIVPFRHAGILESSAREAGVTVTRLDVHGAGHLDMTASVEVQRAIAEFFEAGLQEKTDTPTGD